MGTVRRPGFALVVLVAACGPADTEEGSAPEVEVELFAPGAVSSELPEFAVSFTPSGDTAFFNRTPPDRSRIDLLYSVRTASGWSEAEVFGPLAGVRAIDPFVSLDGTHLYFSADLPREGAPEGAFNLWRLPLADGDARPRPLPSSINTDSSEVFNSFSSQGDMAFSSRRDGERYVYLARRNGDDFDTPERLTLGDGNSASNPALHPSGRYLIFARAPEGAPSDLYLACADGGEWGEPVRLPEPVNSEYTEFAPGFDREHLYFTSERPGVAGPVAAGVRPPGDIYRVRLEHIDSMCEPAGG